MKVIRRALYIDNDLIERCVIVMYDQGVEVILSGAISLKLTNRKASLSLREFEIIKGSGKRIIPINLNEITGLEYVRIKSNPLPLLKLFDGYIGKNPNIYNAYLKTNSKTHRLILTQRDVVKLRNFLMGLNPKLLHSDE